MLRLVAEGPSSRPVVLKVSSPQDDFLRIVQLARSADMTVGVEYDHEGTPHSYDDMDTAGEQVATGPTRSTGGRTMLGCKVTVRPVASAPDDFRVTILWPQVCASNGTLS